MGSLGPRLETGLGLSSTVKSPHLTTKGVRNQTPYKLSPWKLGAFYPFSRDHSAIDTAYQELYLWESVAATARKVLGLRYQLLPYFYTLMFEAHMKGIPIARPLFFSFPEDINTYGISSQFLLGKGLMVSPVLSPGVTSVDAYFPRGNWYDMFNYTLSVSASTGRRVTLSAPPDHINVHVREGNIVAMQREAMTTQAARRTPFHILVVMSNCGPCNGDVFLDDGVELAMGAEGGNWSLVKFSADSATETVTISSSVMNGGFAMRRKWIIDKVTILGLRKGTNIQGCSIQSGARAIKGEGFRLKSSSDKQGQFVLVQISELNLLIGQQFKLKLEVEVEGAN